MVKNSRNHSNSLDIPTQLSRRLRRFPDRSQPLMMGKSGTSRQCYKPGRLAPTSTRDISVESESYFMIGSRDLERRIRFESACRSLTSGDTFFTLPSRARYVRDSRSVRHGSLLVFAYTGEYRSAESSGPVGARADPYPIFLNPPQESAPCDIRFDSR